MPEPLFVANCPDCSMPCTANIYVQGGRTAVTWEIVCGCTYWRNNEHAKSAALKRKVLGKFRYFQKRAEHTANYRAEPRTFLQQIELSDPATHFAPDD